MLPTIYQDAENRMQKCIENLLLDFSKLRTGRAHTSFLDPIKVNYYGSEVPLNQVANVNVADARTFTITPWDKAAIPAIEKAIHGSDLGLNPVTTGQIIRVPLPALTQERRMELVKVVKAETENTRVAIRNVRRDSLSQVKDLLKNKQISEDEEKVAQEKVQQLTDKSIVEADKLMANKEQDLMQV